MQRRFVGSSVAAAAVALMVSSVGSRAADLSVPPDPIEFFSGCGTLHAGGDGNNCWFFETHNGRVYTIETPDSFSNGDVVCVSGQRMNDADCVVPCPSGNGCLINVTIVAGDIGPGTIDLGPQGCPVFDADDGEQLLMSNTGPFTPGARVFVTGPITNQSNLCEPIVAPGFLNNTVEELFEECVAIEPGPQGCPMVTHNGEELMLEGNLGPALIGSNAYLTGIIKRNWDTCPPLVADALIVWSVDTCAPLPDVPGDANGDGVVNFADLLIVISAWGPCACPADVTGNGVADFQDILLILANWST